MTPRELFEINGDAVDSPLIRAARRLHGLFEKAGASYAIIGGLAVARSGAFRTTHDVDVLATREGWARVREVAGGLLETGDESAVDVSSGVHVDLLFPGDDWDMLIPLPAPEAVSEFDDDLGARFMDLGHLIELKCAVYLAKRRDDGIEVAAKDLSDVVELIRSNDPVVDTAMLRGFHPRIGREVGRIARRVRRSMRRRRPRAEA